MMNRRFILLPLFVLLSSLLKAQDSDFGIWYDLKADYNFAKGFRADFEACLRTVNDASEIDSWYLEPGIRYKFNKYFSAGVYYRFIMKMEKDGDYYARHRWALQAKGDMPVGRFTLSLRYRFQEQTKTYIKDPEDEKPIWFSRTRFEVDYDVKGLPLKPYANIEVWNQMFADNDIFIEETRYTIGAEYGIFKHSAIGLEYLYHVSNITKPAYRNIITVNYALSF
ncbi:MAG: DUF2490 domain-containing protein [Bacteroidales bacterium]|jgi:predicted porin|nr:DUF2490 domain-containing protein [Bacteroidales bacterium]